MLSETISQGSKKREMSRVLGQLKKKSIILTAAMMFGSCCFAADINLSEIEFSPSDNGYNIVLKTDKKTTFKKTVQNDEKIVIELKNTATTEDFSTIYNDISTINNITVTPAGKDDLKIQIQGSDISNSNIKVEYKDTPIAVESQNFDKNQINLSLPIENYKPVYNETLTEETEESSGFDSALAKLNPVTMAQNLTNNEENSTDKNNFKWLTYLGLIIIMVTAGKNIFKPSNEAKIGLTQSLKEREKEIAQKLNAGVKETLSLRSKIAQNAAAPSINYGLRSYQNSQKNPYENVSTPIRPVRKPLSAPSYAQTAVKTPLRTQSTQSIASAPSASRLQKSIPNTAPIRTNRAVNVDSMKFLESMTKIYEKNGRADLAMGLKNNINKVNI